jgi:alpha/beta superfamily hydrolase
LNIPVSHGQLEAALREPPGTLRGAGIVCHPHPLQGGTMHTKVVFRAAQALADAKIAALRFNFRGVGTSTGSYEMGVGEKGDVLAALDWLEEKYPGVPLVVGGFSFGSMVGLGAAAEDPRVVALFGLSLPVRMYDYGFLANVQKPILVVQGEEDELGSGSEVEPIVAALGSHVTLARIAGADHYFDGQIDELKSVMSDYFGSGPGGRALSEGLIE